MGGSGFNGSRPTTTTVPQTDQSPSFDVLAHFQQDARHDASEFPSSPPVSPISRLDDADPSFAGSQSGFNAARYEGYDLRDGESEEGHSDADVPATCKFHKLAILPLLTTW